jgi:parallel beta-helix repeat protein
MRQRLWSRLTSANVAATLVSLTVLLTTAVVALVAFGGSRATAAQGLSCGDRITADATLHHDLVDCPNNGIVIGADNVTLDLNYHRIDGDGAPAAGCDPEAEFCDVGVLNRGHDGVTIAHGSVRQFLVGVWGLNVSHNRLLGISSSENECCGLGFFRGTRSVVRNSSGSHTARERRGPGMFLIESHHVRVLHNSFRDNGDQGIFVHGSTHNLFKGNLFSHNEFFGIILERANRNRVRRNRSDRDGEVGIYIAGGNRNVMARNRVSHVRRSEGFGRAIEIDGGDHNVIARNSVRDTEEHAILVGCPRCGGIVGTVVRRNHIRGAGKDGVHVDAKARHTRLKRNRAFGAKDDGLDVNTPKAKLTKNRARRNGDLGIEAVRGVIDGGGNRASGNGDPRQCTNIVCR